MRGICPTLNTQANHGYISRDGITTFAQAVNAVQSGYGFDFSLSVFLSALGLIAGGDLVGGMYSIGAADSRVPNTLGATLGLDKHGTFEIDGSITRQDVYFSNNANFLLQRSNEFVNESEAQGGEFNLATNAVDNDFRYDNSLNETFHDNRYRRGVPLALPVAFEQPAEMFLANPRALGGNQGVGSFIPLDLSTDLSTAIPAQIGCFNLETLLDAAPGQLDPTIYNNFELYTGFIKGRADALYDLVRGILTNSI